MQNLAPPAAIFVILVVKAKANYRRNLCIAECILFRIDVMEVKLARGAIDKAHVGWVGPD